MTIREILQDGNPILRQKSLPADLRDPELPGLIEDLIETMRHVGGIGIAAPQIGVLKRVVIVAHPNWPQAEIMVNPKIMTVGEELIAIQEGCLSVHDQRGFVDRFEFVEVEYTAPHVKFAHARTVFSGLASIIVQHELDHLDGILFIDRVKSGDD